MGLTEGERRGKKYSSFSYSAMEGVYGSKREKGGKNKVVPHIPQVRQGDWETMRGERRGGKDVFSFSVSRQREGMGLKGRKEEK